MEFIVNLQQLISQQIRQLTRGEEVVKWIEYELETLIPQLESAEALSNQSDNPAVFFREMKRQFSEIYDNMTTTIRKAKVLAETYTKRVIQRKAATYSNPIKFIEIGLISKELHEIRYQITLSRDKFSESFKTARLVSSRLAQENLRPRGGDEQSIPSYLKHCIHYFVLFFQDEVPARRLVALWVAEGLVHSKKNDNQPVEQIAERYLVELKNLAVIDVKQNPSRKMKTCKIVPARRSALLEEAKKGLFLKDVDGKIQRLVDHHSVINDGASFIQIDGNPKLFRSLRKYRDVTSLLSFNTKEGSKPGKDIGDFLRKCISAECFIWLYVLDLEGVFRPKLPDTLGELIALKYLGLRWTYLEQLPNVGN